jgi:hypothetical protein
LPRQNEAVERQKEWLRVFRANAERSDQSMGEMLRSLALKILLQKFIYENNPIKTDGKSVDINNDKEMERWALTHDFSNSIKSVSVLWRPRIRYRYDVRHQEPNPIS